jgi:uracil phosphoribosyltransferase
MVCSGRTDENVKIVKHLLVATKLSILCSKTTAPEEFRRNLQELAALLLCEAA